MAEIIKDVVDRDRVTCLGAPVLLGLVWGLQIVCSPQHSAGSEAMPSTPRPDEPASPFEPSTPISWLSLEIEEDFSDNGPHPNDEAKHYACSVPATPPRLRLNARARHPWLLADAQLSPTKVRGPPLRLP
jgi:hypothetical protein